MSRPRYADGGIIRYQIREVGAPLARSRLMQTTITLLTGNQPHVEYRTWNIKI